MKNPQNLTWSKFSKFNAEQIAEWSKSLAEQGYLDVRICGMEREPIYSNNNKGAKLVLDRLYQPFITYAFEHCFYPNRFDSMAKARERGWA